MTSRNIWLISDTHFNHENIIRYCNRPFANAKEMNEALVENWNAVVKPNDIVYHLGDVYMGKRDEAVLILPRLMGKKRLIVGNHDNLQDGLLHKFFQKIMVWRQFKDFGLTLSHVPLHTMSLTEKFPMNVHGHIHDKLVPDNRYKNLCVEHTDYKPINIEDVKNFFPEMNTNNFPRKQDEVFFGMG